MKPISVSSPALIGNEHRYVLECLDAGQLSWHGKFIPLFEKAFAELCQVPHAIACCNGTAALHLALLGAGVRPRDVVYLPALTYISTANAVRYIGAEPIFCDVDIDSWCLDPESVLAKIQRGRKGAILPVHLYGVPAPIHELQDIARRFDLVVVEDAAEAPGATTYSRPVGSFGEAAAFSFFANKIITTGEGGIVTTKSDDVAAKIRHLRGQAQTDRRFYHDMVGYNYRMTNIQAAIGLAQIEKFTTHVTRRAKVVQWYNARLENRARLQITPADSTSANWMFSVRLPVTINRDFVINELQQDGIETRPAFIPLTMLPPYRQKTPIHCAQLGAQVINLPTHSLLMEEDVDQIVQALSRFLP